MTAFLEYVLKSLVDYPEDVVVTRSVFGAAPGESITPREIYQAEVRRSDAGKVIGKQGQTIGAIRALMQVGAERSGRKVSFELLD
ncbi:MAG: hypothetical protein RIS92_770 [Verrucomicrobiota bacterium]|jgi:predicted RNA-binding protein YlqC (UPF0109 family)